SLDVSSVPADPRGAGRYVVELVRALAARRNVRLHLILKHGDAARWRRWAPDARLHATVPAWRPARILWEQAVEPYLITRYDIALHHGPHYTMPERLRR